MEEDAVCTKLLAVEELLWWGRDLQMLGMGRVEKWLKTEQAETGAQKPNFPNYRGYLVNNWQCPSCPQAAGEH